MAFWADLTAESNQRALFVSRNGALMLVLRAADVQADGTTLLSDGLFPVVVGRATAVDGATQTRLYRVDGPTPTLLLTVNAPAAVAGKGIATDRFTVRSNAIVRHTSYDFPPIAGRTPGSHAGDILSVFRGGVESIILNTISGTSDFGITAASHISIGLDGQSVHFRGVAVSFTGTSGAASPAGVYRWQNGLLTQLIDPNVSLSGARLTIIAMAVADDGDIALLDKANSRALLWHAGTFTPVAASGQSASGGAAIDLSTAQNLWIDAQFVYLPGTRLGTYPGGTSPRTTTDLVFRVSRGGGAFDLLFDPRKVFSDIDALTLSAIAIGGTPTQLSVSVSHYSTSWQAIYAGPPTYSATAFPAVPPGYPVVTLADLGSGFTYAYGKTTQFVPQVSGPGPFTYGWSINGAMIEAENLLYQGASSGTLTLFPFPQDYHRGTYTVAVSNAAGTSYVTSFVQIGVNGTENLDGRLYPPIINYSVRGYTSGTGATFIGGITLVPPLNSFGYTPSGDFYDWVPGTTQRLLVRAVGPGLAPFTGPSVLPAPATSLTLFSGATPLMINNGAWDSDPQMVGAAAAVGAFALPAGSRDSALLATLVPQSYTAQVGAPAGNGSVLLEFYTIGGGSNLRNLAALGTVSDHDPQSLYIGFVLGIMPGRTEFNPGARIVLLRAAGPGLRGFGVTNAIDRPTIQLYSGGKLLAQNSGLETSPNSSAIVAAAATFGAFPYVPGSNDAALLLQLPAGEYVIKVNGAPGSSGVALAEFYTGISF
ncbi:MAG: hypothetical protein Q7S40_35085 [Opitutaceae bacterium]|nr:hypothetical protein [Opitutaceae bacterium]